MSNYTVKELLVEMEFAISLNREPDFYLFRIERLLKFHPFLGLHFNNEYIYRGRLNENIELFYRYEELVNPKIVKKKGRFNDVDEQVFYGATGELHAYTENKKPVNRLITITKFQKDPSKIFNCVHLGEIKSTENVSEKKDVDLINDFLKKQITKEITNQNDYNFTIALANFFFSKNLKLKIGKRTNGRFGIIYPSIESMRIGETSGANIAMLPSSFKENFKPVTTHLYTTELNMTEYLLLELNYGVISRQGDIVWRFDLETLKRRVKKGLLVDDYIHDRLIGTDYSSLLTK